MIGTKNSSYGFWGTWENHRRDVMNSWIEDTRTDYEKTILAIHTHDAWRAAINALRSNYVKSEEKARKCLDSARGRHLAGSVIAWIAEGKTLEDAITDALVPHMRSEGYR